MSPTITTTNRVYARVCARVCCEICTVPWQVLWLEARDLMREQAAQFAIPDLEAYIGSQSEIVEAESRGLTDCTLARLDSVCVGYLCWLIGGHSGLSSSRVARMGPWYIQAGSRSVGLALKMFRHSLESLRSKSVSHALPTMPLKHPGRVREHAMLRRVGARPFELTWMIEL